MALPADVERLIPHSIEKGIYDRCCPRRDGNVRLVWWVKAYDQQSRPSMKAQLPEDAVKLEKKIIAQVENLQRSGGRADSTRINELLDDMLSDSQAKPNSRYVYRLVIDGHT